MSKKVQLELQHIFKTNVKTYLNHWDREDIYVYKYKFKVNDIYIVVNIECDKINTMSFESIMHEVLDKVFKQLKLFY